MSFRSGPIVRCIIYDLDDYSRKCITLNKATIFDLNILLQNENNRIIFVKRRDRLFIIKTNRDVEEIGHYSGQDIIYIANNTTIDMRNAISLSRYQCERSEIPAKIDMYGDCVISSQDIMSKGRLIYDALRKHGFFRIVLNDDEVSNVNKIFNMMKWFTEQSRQLKDQYSYRSIGSDNTQPQFGYRETDLSKEYFVCRKLSDENKGVICEALKHFAHSPKPPLKIFRKSPPFNLKYPSKDFEACVNQYMTMMGEITKYILVALLFEIGCDRYQIRSIIDGTLLPAKSLQSLGFTSMTEMFKYDCSGYVDGQHNIRIPCGDHFDVSLFTIIPYCRGTPGLEVFDWSREWLRVEEDANVFKNECIVFPGEQLQRITAGLVSATPHRVVLEVGLDKEDRYSAPFELLLDPDYRIDCNSLLPESADISDTYKTIECAQDYISRISQTLVSVNK